MNKPDFISIGTSKSGTTFFYRLLLQNKKFFKAKEKEFQFFGFEGLKEEDYLNYFKQFDLVKKEQISYDLSTNYYRHAFALEQIAEKIPDVKVVVFLRNPMKRAISHLHFNNFIYNYRTSIEDMIKTYKWNIYKYNSMVDKREKDYDYLTTEIIDSSFYFKKLRRCFEYFPEENIKIIFFEELIKEPQKIMDDFHKFLGIENFEYNIEVDKMETVKINKYVYYPIKLTDILIKRIPTSNHNKILRLTKYIKRKTGKKVEKHVNEDIFIKELQSIFQEDIDNLARYLKKDLNSLWKLK